MLRRFLPSLLITAAGCAAGNGGVGPRPPQAAPVDAAAVTEWVTETRSPGPKPDSLTFNWRYTGSSVDGAPTGRGTVMVAHPDSLRLDFWAALGVGRGAAFILGDTAVWAVPKEKVAQFVPSYPLLWGLIGQARPPARGAAAIGARTGTTAWWQYLSGGDTVTYLLDRGKERKLAVQVVTGGKLVGNVVASFDADGKIVTSVLTLPRGTGRLELTFKRVLRPDALAADLWRAPDDSL